MIDKIEQTTDETPKKPVVQDDKPLRRVTAKEKAYVAAIAEGKTRRDAVKGAYDVKPNGSVKTLDKMADLIEKRPAVMALLQKHEEEAQEVVVDVMRYAKEYGSTRDRDGAQYARVALDGANSLLDRIHGKAMQQIQMNSTSVNINVDLSQ